MKKLKSDTAAAQVAAMVEAALPTLACPAHVRLRPGDLPFWEGIVRARTRDEWIAADLVVAGQLARCQYDIEEESKTLDDEGKVETNDRGTRVCNPRVAVLEQLARREMALMRTLRMGGRVAGDTRDQLGKRQAVRAAGKVRAEIEEEDFLAT